MRFMVFPYVLAAQTWRVVYIMFLCAVSPKASWDFGFLLNQRDCSLHLNYSLSGGELRINNYFIGSKRYNFYQLAQGKNK